MVLKVGNVSSKAWTLVQYFDRAVRLESPVVGSRSERHSYGHSRLIVFVTSVGYSCNSSDQFMPDPRSWKPNLGDII